MVKCWPLHLSPMHYSRRGCRKAWQSCREDYAKVPKTGIFLNFFFCVCVWVGEMSSPLSALMRRIQKQDLWTTCWSEAFSPVVSEREVRAEDAEIQSHRAAVTDARICKWSHGWLSSLKGLPAVDVDIDIWVISHPRTKLWASYSLQMLHDSGNILGHI